MAQNNLKFAPTANAFNTTLNGAISNTATTITLNSVTNLQNKAGILVIDRQNADGDDTPTVREYIYFTSVSGSSVVLPDVADGRGQGGSTGQSHADGAIVEAIMDVDQWNGLVDAFDAQHNDDGTHDNVTSDTLGLSGNASLGGNLFAHTLDMTSAASIIGPVNLGNLNLPSTASGYFQQGLPVTHLGAEGILRLNQMRYQEDNADSIGNSTEENVVVQFGWGQVVGNGAGKVSDAVTFPTAFGAAPLYISANYIGTNTGAGADIEAFVATHGTGTTITAAARSAATTGMTVDLHRSDAGTLSAANRFAYSWIAIGVTA